MSDQASQSPVKEVIFNQADINELNSFIQEMPTKFGVPLIDFVNGIIRRNKEEAQKASAAPEAPAS